jgi:hypothetical protein
MLPLAHGALGYLDELLPFFLIAGFAIILIVVAFLSRKTESTLADKNSDTEEPPISSDTPSSSGKPDPSPDHFRLD